MNTKETVLQKCTVEGNVVKLPNEQLDRKDYLDLKKKLEGIGGKWVGGKTAGFVFQTDPTERLEEITGGKKVNLKKDFQFFETPKELVEDIIAAAEIESYHKILEPSVGRGAILRGILEEVPTVVVDCYELMPENREILERTGMQFNLIGEDFMKHEGKTYDRIVANPPFTKNQDIKHLQTMYRLLNKGGRVVCITSTSWKQGSSKLHQDFRQWLEDVGAACHDIEKGAFKGSGTNIATCMVIIDKN